MDRVALGLEPGRRSQGFDFRGLGFGQAFKEIVQIFRWINAKAPTTAQHRVDHRAALARLGVADEKEVASSTFVMGKKVEGKGKTG